MGIFSLIYILDIISDAFNKLRIIRIVRPDMMIQVANEFVEKVFERSLHSTMDFKSAVLSEVSSLSPIAICCVSGYDASFRVEHLARDLSVDLSTIAIGSSEGFGLAEKAIANGFRSGTWVL